MQGLQKGVVLVMALTIAWTVPVFGGTYSDSDSEFRSDITAAGGVVIAQRKSRRIVFSEVGRGPTLHEVKVPGASFLKLHFSYFNLPQGVTVEISDPGGNELWRYSTGLRDQFTFDSSLGDDGVLSFSAMSITGDTAIVRLTGDLKKMDPDQHLVVIDSVLEGLPLVSGQSPAKSRSKSGGHATESACGEDQRPDAACWASSHPWETERAYAVAKLITSGGEVCTAWRVGQDNRMFTAQHCLTKQSKLDGAEIWFNYQHKSCGSSQTTTPLKLTGKTLLASDGTLDFSLFSVNDFSSLWNYPSFGLDVRDGDEGEAIYIPQHGYGEPLQIAMESDMNASGLCEIDEASRDSYSPGSDIGYFCDTVSSSSGAPVVSAETGRVLALHHFGGCLNAGVKMTAVWPEVSAHFGGKVPIGDSGGNQPPANELPEVDLNASCSDLNCIFDASGSTDPDGTIEAFHWSLSDGSDSSASGFEHEFQDEGSYEVVLTVEDNEGGSSSESQILEVSLPNKDPVARITTSCVNLTCQFNAGGSYDNDGNITTWEWSLGDGSMANGENIEHEYSTEGSYTITLTVEDNDGASDDSSRTVSLNMPNENPSASFVYSCTELECTFDAGNSIDPDGNITAWNWDFGDGSNGSGSSISHSYSEDGSFTVTLNVTDDDGAIDELDRNVTVTAVIPNQFPEADFSFSCEESRCNFDAGSSQDPDGTIVSWRWAFGDGSSADGESVSHSYLASGNYTVKLTVEDSEGATGVRTRTVSPEKTNSTPSASFTYTCDETTCRFDAGNSSDSDGEITGYYWNFGDGMTANGSVIEHEYSGAGSFSVKLTVEDNEGDSDSRTRTVAVKEHRPEILLTGDGGRFNNRSVATLRWSGAESEQVEIYRNGKSIAVTINDGKHVDTKIESEAKAATYQICQAGTDFCSRKIELDFTP